MELTQEEITTGNQLIADFMQPFSEMAFSSYYYMPQHSFINCKYGEYFTEDCFKPEEMKYHSSWDWLMPVVEKIENISIGRFAKQIKMDDCAPIDGYFWFKTSKDIIRIYANVYYWNPEYDIEGLTQNFEGDTKIEATYKAVIEFIKWYNQQK